jgi:Trypsin-like peptidase domain
VKRKKSSPKTTAVSRLAILPRDEKMANGKIVKRPKQRRVAQRGLSPEELARRVFYMRAEGVLLSSLPPIYFEQTSGQPAPISDQLVGGFPAIKGEANAKLKRLLELSKRVGRIDDQHGRHLGTGFLIKDNLIATAAHVAAAVDGGCTIKFEVWPTTLGGMPLGAVRCIPKVVKPLHFARDSADIALIDLAQPVAGFSNLQSDIDVEVTEPGGAVAVLSYPGSPSLLEGAEQSTQQASTVAALIKEIFEPTGTKLYGSKCVTLGLLRQDMEPNVSQDYYFGHDAPTLGGSSGGLVVDLLTEKIIGVHCANTVMVNNYFQSFAQAIEDKSDSGSGYGQNLKTMLTT